MKKVNLKKTILTGGFSPLELKGIQLELAEHGYFKFLGNIENSNQLKSFFEDDLSSCDLLILNSENSDFFNPDNIESNSALFRTHPTIVLTKPNPKLVFSIHKHHVVGMLSVMVEPDEIFSCIQKVLQGEKYFSAPIVDALVSYTYNYRNAIELNKSEVFEKSVQPLSIRELQILRLVVKGKSTKEIAEELFLSVHTIYTHRKNILKKLSCKNAAELVSIALDRGLLKEIA